MLYLEMLVFPPLFHCIASLIRIEVYIIDFVL
jgi:hypothetical protein